MRASARLSIIPRESFILLGPKRLSNTSKTAFSAMPSPSPSSSPSLSSLPLSPAAVRDQFRQVFHVGAYQEQSAAAALAGYHRAHRIDQQKGQEVAAAAAAAGGDGECRAVAGRVAAVTPPQQLRQLKLSFTPRKLTTTATATTAATTPTVGSFPCFEFLTNRRRDVPGNETIAELLALGEGPAWAPRTLERRHDYVQWLFPLRERGVNWAAPLLTSAEAARIKADPVAMANALRGFRMMCRFYGTQLTFAPDVTTTTTGSNRNSNGDSSTSGEATTTLLTAELRRTSDASELAAQYGNLRASPHNYLRVTRILQCLGELGLEPLKLAWLRFLMRDIVPSPHPEGGGGWGGTYDDHYDDGSDDGGLTAPLAPCAGSFAAFWLQTPYAASDRLALMEEALAMAGASGHVSTGPADGFVVRASGLVVPAGVLASRELFPPPRAAKKRARGK